MTTEALIHVLPVFWAIEKRSAERRQQRRPTATDIRAEIEQTPEWWDREYRKLNLHAFPPKPFDPAEHEGHEIVTWMAYDNTTVLRTCTECGTDDRRTTTTQ